jgi:hypothetical protein
MVKPINNIINADNTSLSRTLQVMLPGDDFKCGVTSTMASCIFKNLKMPSVIYFKRSRTCSQPYFYLSQHCNLYQRRPVVVLAKQKTTNIDTCKINAQFKSLAKIGGGHWKCQRDIEANEQHGSEEINVWLRLYRSILGKCRYTSLELAVRSTALKAYSIANFLAANPVGVESSENNKEQCHRLWQCQTIVDS